VQPAPTVIAGASRYHTAVVATLLWSRNKAGDSAQARREGRDTLYCLAGCCGGWLWGQLLAAWGCAGLRHREGVGKHHFEPATPWPFLGCEMFVFQSFPTWVITGQVRIFLIDSILVGFLVLLACCSGCVV